LVYRFDDDFIYLVQAKGHYPSPPDELTLEDTELKNVKLENIEEHQ